MRPLLVLAAVAAFALIGCGRDSTRPASPYRSAFSSLCQARVEARAGDFRSAGRTFFDRVHQPIHELATLSATTDRAAAARLLEAKRPVEEDVNQSRDSTLASDLERLLPAMAHAIEVTGAARPACPSNGG